ncbi:hypothetical protein [Nocardiopsis flavescens]|nr:hypothetical protein [Nocardiopsis flavescens]
MTMTTLHIGTTPDGAPYALPLGGSLLIASGAGGGSTTLGLTLAAAARRAGAEVIVSATDHDTPAYAEHAHQVQTHAPAEVIAHAERLTLHRRPGHENPPVVCIVDDPYHGAAGPGRARAGGRAEATVEVVADTGAEVGVMVVWMHYRWHRASTPTYVAVRHATAQMVPPWFGSALPPAEPGGWLIGRPGTAPAEVRVPFPAPTTAAGGDRS